MVVGILVGALLILVLGLYFLKPKSPKPSASIDTVDELDDYLQRVVAAQHPPGLSGQSHMEKQG